MELSEEVKKIVQSAIKLENDGIKFYTDASNKILHPLGKAVFKSFVEEEKKHLGKLEKLFKAEVDTTSYESNDSFDRLKEVFRKMYKDGDVTVDADADDLQAIRSAIDFEKEGSDIYEVAITGSKTQTEKELFIFLSNEEKTHQTVLENMHDELEKAYKQEARNEQKTQLEWEKRLFTNPAIAGVRY